MTRSSKRTRTTPDEWPGGPSILVYMIQHLDPSELPPAPWTLVVTNDEVRGVWPPTVGCGGVASRVLVKDNEAWLRDLLKETNEGPRSPRARTGELVGELRALAKVVTSRQHFLDWRRREERKANEQR